MTILHAKNQSKVAICIIMQRAVHLVFDSSMQTHGLVIKVSDSESGDLGLIPTDY